MRCFPATDTSFKPFLWKYHQEKQRKNHSNISINQNHINHINQNSFLNILAKKIVHGKYFIALFVTDFSFFKYSSLVLKNPPVPYIAFEENVHSPCLFHQLCLIFTRKLSTGSYYSTHRIYFRPKIKAKDLEYTRC